MSKGILLKLH